jgi:hypothetical protein
MRNLIERDELCRRISLLLEIRDADRGQYPHHSGFGTLGCHLLGRAAECPSERRESYGQKLVTA